MEVGAVVVSATEDRVEVFTGWEEGDEAQIIRSAVRPSGPSEN